MPTGTQIILTDIFRRFPQSLQTNAGTLSQIRTRLLPSTSFPVHYRRYIKRPTLS
jgi:hypothetical protein